MYFNTSIVSANVNNKHKRTISANAHFKIRLQNTNKNSFLILFVTKLVLFIKNNYTCTLDLKPYIIL